MCEKKLCYLYVEPLLLTVHTVYSTYYHNHHHRHNHFHYHFPRHSHHYHYHMNININIWGNRNPATSEGGTSSRPLTSISSTVHDLVANVGGGGVAEKEPAP
jgi:hypothetical protein